MGSWKDRRLLFITGPHASGKSKLAEVALSNAGFIIFDTGPILRDYYQSSGIDDSFGDWVRSNESQYGKNFTDELLARHISEVASNDTRSRAGIVIVGNRSYPGIEYLIQRLSPSDTRVVYVVADTEHLYQRYITREDKQDISRQAFDAVLNVDREMGLDKIMNQAGLVIHNDVDIGKAANQLLSFVESWDEPNPQ